MILPPNSRPGQPLQFKTADGRVFTVTVPPGVQPGGRFKLQVPAAAPQPARPAAPPGGVPMGLPVGGGGDGGAAVTAYNAPQSSVALKHAECPITFEPLHKAPVGVFLNAQGRRVSPHFFGLEAAQQWLQQGNVTCPMTRAPVASVLPVPSLTHDAEGWYRAIDVDGDGRLSRTEVIEALKAQLPTDNAMLEEALNDPNHWMWQQWDTDRSGYIEKNELLSPQGLIAYVRSQCLSTREEAGAIPDIKRDKEAWYLYWDEDRSGSLEQEEVVRALIKTYKLGQSNQQLQAMRSTVQAIWPIFDADNSMSIDRQEFLQPDGLADTVIANMGL